MPFDAPTILAEIDAFHIMLQCNLRQLETVGDKKACGEIVSKLERMRHEVNGTYAKIKKRERE